MGVVESVPSLLTTDARSSFIDTRSDIQTGDITLKNYIYEIAQRSSIRFVKGCGSAGRRFPAPSLAFQAGTI